MGAALPRQGDRGWLLKGFSSLGSSRERGKKKTQALGKVNAKRRFLVTGLLMAALLGVYALRCYSWTMDYEITSLMESTRITVPVKNMNFSESPVELSPKVDAVITTFKPNTTVHFKINEMPYSITLAKVFYSVEILIKVGGKYTMFTLVNNNRWWGNGDVEGSLILPSPVTRAPLEITVLATAARHGSVSEVVEIVVSLIETS